MRAQMNLPALAVALVLVTATAVVGFGMADRAFRSADRTPAERRIAVSLSERLVAAESPVSARPNVLDAAALDRLNASRLEALFPVARDGAVRVRLGDRTLAATGTPSGGVTIRRIVLVERRQRVALTPTLAGTDPEVTLPRRAPSVQVAVDPPDGTTVRAVRANDRVVLRNPGGLAGSFEVDLSRFETTTLGFETDGPLPTGSVELTYAPANTTKAVVAVTADA